MNQLLLLISGRESNSSIRSERQPEFHWISHIYRGPSLRGSLERLQRATETPAYTAAGRHERDDYGCVVDVDLPWSIDHTSSVCCTASNVFRREFWAVISSRIQSYWWCKYSCDFLIVLSCFLTGCAGMFRFESYFSECGYPKIIMCNYSTFTSYYG